MRALALKTVPPSSLALCAELDQIIRCRRLVSWLQPIVDLQRDHILGYEALVRGPADGPLHSPGQLFEAASRYNRLIELELICLEVHTTHFAQLRLPGRLFLNINPATLLQSAFSLRFTRRFLGRLGIRPEQVVLELSEELPIDDCDRLRQASTPYRDMGFTFALDDLGTAYAGLRAWSELRPEFVKIDKHFVQGLDADPAKRCFIQGVQSIAQGLKCMVIAEGIETKQEHRAIRSLNVAFGQGHYLARPSATPPHHIG